MNKKIPWLVTLLLLAAVTFAGAQQAPKNPRIGFLHASAGLTPDARTRFLQGLRKFGYIEGENITIEYRSAKGQFERLPVLAAELVSLKVDVILTGGSTATRAAKEATNTIPIVMLQDNDPVASGFVTSLARAGREHYWTINPSPRDQRKTTGASQGNCSWVIPHRRARGVRQPGQRPSVKRGGTRRRSIKSAASISRHTKSQGY